MTWVTPTPTSPSAGVPATKFGIAIGSGATFALGNDDALRRLAEGSVDRTAQQHTGRRHSRNQLPAAQAERHLGKSIFVSHCFGLHSHL